MTPQERFKLIATIRTNKVLNEIRKLGNLSNKYYYEYTEQQIDETFNAIYKKLRQVKKIMKKEKVKEFKF